MVGPQTTVVPCPRCGVFWPHSAYRDAPVDPRLVDWTCGVCLHAEVAALRRQVVSLERQLSAARGERDE